MGQGKKSFQIGLRWMKGNHLYCLTHADFLKEGEFVARVRV